MLLRETQAITAAVVISLLLCACSHKSIQADPALVTYQQQLQRDLPTGSTQASVEAYLAGNHYAVRHYERPGVLVAEPGPETPTPAGVGKARVTFYFDATHKLNTFELSRSDN